MLSNKNLLFIFFSLIITFSIFLLHVRCTSLSSIFLGGEWHVLNANIGISAMHMQLLHNDKIIMFDRTDFGPSNLSLPLGRCRFDSSDTVLKTDCTAHSLLYDITTNAIRPLMVQTDTFCSSGSVLPDGTLVQTGGYNDGDHNVRTFVPCNNDECDWMEYPKYLSVRRWYASNQILPDGRIIIIGGRRQFSYEFYPREPSMSTHRLQFLIDTRDYYENNLYPFLHLLPDGNLFIFANTRSILLDYVRNRVVREFPQFPGNDSRNYPSTGSSVLLPLRFMSEHYNIVEAEVLVCGGAPQGSFSNAKHGIFQSASSTCGRIKVTDPEPNWQIEQMPIPRVMGDMLILPTGDVIIMNGASRGTAGWEMARDPATNPIVYRTYENANERFMMMFPSSTPRMYHSSAVLLRDGRILVGGSNPHTYYDFTNALYPTELSIEAFSPPYLAPEYDRIRPKIVSHSEIVNYGQSLFVTFDVPINLAVKNVSITVLAPSFTTHSFAMNQRLVVLRVAGISQVRYCTYQVSAIGPPIAEIAPRGYYILFVVHAGVPSSGVWVNIQ